MHTNDSTTYAQDYLNVFSTQAKTYIPAIHKKLLSLYSKENGPYYEAILYFETLLTKGKFFRGALFLAALQALGNTSASSYITISISLEILQTSLLIHDDIMDGDVQRRGIDTVHTYFSKQSNRLHVADFPDNYGRSMAVCLGDLGLYVALEFLRDSKLELKIYEKIMAQYIHMVQKVIVGQILDISTNTMHNNQDDILTLYTYKTVEYTTMLPWKLASTIQGVTNKTILRAIDRYAACLGWIFQITDDYLGIFGNPDHTGKATMQDIRNGKNTLLISEVKQNLSKSERHTFESFMGNKNLSVTEQEHIITLINKSGAISKVETKLNQYTNESYEALSHITDDQRAIQLLQSFIRLAKNRKT